MDPITTTELLFSLDEVRVGDVVRVPGRPPWCVVVRVDPPEPDEAGPTLRLCPVGQGAPRSASGRVERMVDPGPWLRLQPTEPLVVAAIALQVAEPASPGAVRARAAIEQAVAARPAARAATLVARASPKRRAAVQRRMPRPESDR